MRAELFCARVRGGLLAHGHRAQVDYNERTGRLIVRAGDRWFEMPLLVEEVTGQRYGWLDFRRIIVGGLLEVLEMPGQDYARLSRSSGR